MPRTAPQLGSCHAFTIMLALTVAGCGSIRTSATNLGSDVAGALRETQPELFEIERQLADSAGTFVGRAIEDKVLTRASGVWDTMLLKMNDQTGAVVGRVAAGVERDLNRSLQVMLYENLTLANHETGLLVDHALARATAGMRPLFDTLRIGLEEELGPVLIRILTAAAESATVRVDSLDRVLDRSRTVKRVSWLVVLVIGGLAVTVIGGGIAWRWDYTRTKRAFRVAMANTPPIHRDAVQSQLRTKGFGRQADWLE